LALNGSLPILREFLLHLCGVAVSVLCYHLAPESIGEKEPAMKRIVLLSITLVASAFLATQRDAAAQTGNLNAELLKDWTEQKAIMMKIADAMPEEKFSYKSTPAQRDYGQQILHVAGGNIMYLQFFGGKAAAPTINRGAASKAEILKALADSFDYGAALITEQTDQSMMQTIQTNAYLGPSSKARVIYFLIGHTWDIYGQMAVYLRLNGITPPRSQRP
jgi:uncharacterized damage-inducible protein DinB